MKAQKLHILKTDSTNEDFINLVKQLDADLANRDGEDHSFYAQFNGITHLNHALVFYIENKAVACGAFKEVNADTVEVKRMYTLPDYRGRGIAANLLKDLEEWAYALQFKKCRLETGQKQPEAISLYKRNGYQVIPNYEPYVGVINSVCFEKVLE
ncbi:GNAT family N-acetyltransferase [Aquimarina sp. ERC-38]|uniref:GNAT family N-acetyltransferase n=1 Tax=Aquimarina sp. ERC-38 TaxID=2949996 RepID=UPI002245CD4D|nr:GNAT family N-acetyltransferase [Aquimarina sp. ERC-38]UZO81403.1 GNAT family N-acetyltransferase [Aquimarina sp. ERC-38]